MSEILNVIPSTLEKMPTLESTPTPHFPSVVYVWAHYTLHCVCVITSRHTRNRGAAAEVDAVRAHFGLTTRD